MTNGNLAYKYNNAVFNVALYEAQHGEIETIEHPEKVWLHDIKQSGECANLKQNRTLETARLRKLRYQKKLGLASLAMFAVCMLIGMQIEEMYMLAIMFLTGGIGLIRAKSVIV